MATIAAMSSRGQIVLPIAIRRKLGLGEGTQFLVVTDNENILLCWLGSGGCNFLLYHLGGKDSLKPLATIRCCKTLSCGAQENNGQRINTRCVLHSALFSVQRTP